MHLSKTVVLVCNYDQQIMVDHFDVISLKHYPSVMLYIEINSYERRRKVLLGLIFGHTEIN